MILWISTDRQVTEVLFGVANVTRLAASIGSVFFSAEKNFNGVRCRDLPGSGKATGGVTRDLSWIITIRKETSVRPSIRVHAPWRFLIGRTDREFVGSTVAKKVNVGDSEIRERR